MQAKCSDTPLLSLTQLDREHWELIAEENEFTGEVEAGASRAELEMRLTHLMESFQDHFRSEEELMRLNSFPGLALHTEEHRKLIGQMRELRDALDSGAVKLCGALVSFVRLWTERHMAGPDRCFAQFLHDESTRCTPRSFLDLAVTSAEDLVQME